MFQPIIYGLIFISVYLMLGGLYFLAFGKQIKQDKQGQPPPLAAAGRPRYRRSALDPAPGARERREIRRAASHRQSGRQGPPREHRDLSAHRTIILVIAADGRVL